VSDQWDTVVPDRHSAWNVYDTYVAPIAGRRSGRRDHKLIHVYFDGTHYYRDRRGEGADVELLDVGGGDIQTLLPGDAQRRQWELVYLVRVMRRGEDYLRLLRLPQGTGRKERWRIYTYKLSGESLYLRWAKKVGRRGRAADQPLDELPEEVRDFIHLNEDEVLEGVTPALIAGSREVEDLRVAGGGLYWDFTIEVMVSSRHTRSAVRRAARKAIRMLKVGRTNV
jgi:hypothetical protein